MQRDLTNDHSNYLAILQHSVDMINSVHCSVKFLLNRKWEAIWPRTCLKWIYRDFGNVVFFQQIRRSFTEFLKYSGCVSMEPFSKSVQLATRRNYRSKSLLPYMLTQHLKVIIRQKRNIRIHKTLKQWYLFDWMDWFAFSSYCWWLKTELVERN